MKKSVNNSFTGYIEGYYGKILTWSQRRKIVKKLYDTKMSHYLYAPKSDLFHRKKWREGYSNNWLKSFTNFTNYSKKKNITIIAGISPGLDISFQENEIKKELEFLTNKSKLLIENGADEIAILFDDVPKNTSLPEGYLETDGDYHAFFINKLGENLNKDLFVVPKIYAYELKYSDQNYIEKFLKKLNNNHKLFFCGKNIVARDKNDLSFILNTQNQIIVWDNIYANDYCPKKLVISPWKHRENIKSIMINPTGLIETDLLILDLMSLVLGKVDPNLAWLQILKKYKIPKEINILKEFLNPYSIYNERFSFTDKKIDKIISSIDQLLWKWHSPLALEWYTYLFNLKQDFIISCKNPDKKVITKTQTIPLSSYILKQLKL